MDKSNYQIIDYLNKSTPLGSGILAPYPLSNMLPALTTNRVYFGHDSQTPQAGVKKIEVDTFLQNRYTEAEAHNFLIDNAIRYVISDNTNTIYNFLKTRPFLDSKYTLFYY